MNRVRYNRRTAPRVVDGKVRKKNRTTPTVRSALVIDRQSPSAGCRHTVTKADVRKFIGLIPDWEEFAPGVHRVLLSRGNTDYDGLYDFYPREQSAVIELSAWSKSFWFLMTSEFFGEHQAILDRLGVSHDEPDEEGFIPVRFTDDQARAFMLLHVFLHELGHHLERMGKSTNADLDEAFAERFANDRFESIYPAYIEAFGNPALSRS